jgi:hypothetical protein
MVSVLALTMMVVLTASLVLMPSIMGRQASVHSGSVLEATNASEAALDFGLAALNSTIPGGSNASLASMPASFVRGTGAAADTWAYSDANNGHFFRQTFGVAPQLTIRIPATVPVPGGTGVAADYRIIRAETNWRGAQKRMEAIVRLRTNTVEAAYNPFTRAITARGNLAANGTDGTPRTDSYDSAAGPYGGGNLGNNGGVHTNGSIVDGGLYKGNVSAVGTIDAGVSVFGYGNTVRPGADAEEIPDPPPAPAVTTTVAVSLPQVVTPTSGQVVGLGAVAISGNASKVLTLNAGTYVLDSLRTTGNASILIGTGPVTIFVRGDIDVQGNGLVNSSALPPNLRIVATNPSSTVSLAGNGNFYGAVQAPNNAVTIGGNGEFFGAIVANSFGFNGSNSVVHYDDAIGRASASTAMVVRPAQFQTVAINVLNRND